MFDLLFVIVTALIFSRLAIFGLRATWSIVKFVISIVLLPLFLCFAFFKGLVYLAWPILLVVAIYSIFFCRK